MSGINIGVSVEAVRAARDSVLDIVNATAGRGDAVALSALETLRTIVATDARFDHCEFNVNQPPTTPEAVQVPAHPAGVTTKPDDWPLEYPYDPPQASVDLGRTGVGPAVEVRQEVVPPPAASAADEIAPWYVGGAANEMAPAPPPSAAERAMDNEAQVGAPIAETPPVG